MVDKKNGGGKKGGGKKKPPTPIDQVAPVSSGSPSGEIRQDQTNQPQQNVSDASVVNLTAALVRWTRVMAVATIALGVVVFFQWLALKNTDDHIAGQLKVMRAGQRAWISIEAVEIAGPLKIREDRYATIPIKLVLRNTGNLPALNIHEILHLSPSNWGERVPADCNTRSDIGSSLFPNASTEGQTWSSIANTESGGESTPVPEGRFHLGIAGCVIYHSAGDPGTPHMTSFTAYLIPPGGAGGMGFEANKSVYEPNEMKLLVTPIVGSHAN